MDQPLIARAWHGRTAASQADEYLKFLIERAIPDYQSIAGADIEQAKYYPEDQAFLLEFKPMVTHYEVCAVAATG